MQLFFRILEVLWKEFHHLVFSPKVTIYRLTIKETSAKLHNQKTLTLILIEYKTRISNLYYKVLFCLPQTLFLKFGTQSGKKVNNTVKKFLLFWTNVILAINRVKSCYFLYSIYFLTLRFNKIHYLNAQRATPLSYN